MSWQKVLGLLRKLQAALAHPKPKQAPLSERAIRVAAKVFLGGVASAFDRGFHAAEDLACIVNCTTHVPCVIDEARVLDVTTDVDVEQHLDACWQAGDVAYLRIPVEDTRSHADIDGMAAALPRAVQAIVHCEAHGRRVLVHGFAGEQRAACVVAAYFMQTRGLSPQDAVACVRKHSAGVAFAPGVNFYCALQEFEGFEAV